MSETTETKQRTVSTSYLERIREGKNLDVINFLQSMMNYVKKNENLNDNFQEAITAYAQANKSSKASAKNTSKDVNIDIITEILENKHFNISGFQEIVSIRKAPRVDGRYNVTYTSDNDIEGKINVTINEERTEVFWGVGSYFIGETIILSEVGIGSTINTNINTDDDEDIDDEDETDDEELIDDLLKSNVIEDDVWE